MKAGGNPRLSMDSREHSANRDKVSIILNIAKLGAVLCPSHEKPPATVDECIRSLLLLALAAKEPASLCTSGSPLKIHNEMRTWLFSPEKHNISAGFETKIPQQVKISTGSNTMFK
jgi:hypothetical protein